MDLEHAPRPSAPSPSAPPLLVSKDTFASLPGCLSVQYPAWVRCFPARTVPQMLLLALLLLGALGVLLATAAHSPLGLWPFGLGAVALVRRLDFKFRLIREHFLHGCLNPGRVVSLDPPLVAVYTDMTHTPGQSWPAVKVLRQPLNRARGAQPRLGDRVATVALYHGSRRRPHWDDFSPVAAQCVTDDQGAVRRALARLDADPDDAWAALDRALALVPTPAAPGLYWVAPAAAPVPAAPHNPFLPPARRPAE